MLSCHGKGGNLSFHCQSVAAWHDELTVAVLLFDYPGYGKSGGAPSEAGCYAAADAAYQPFATPDLRCFPVPYQPNIPFPFISQAAAVSSTQH